MALPHSHFIRRFMTRDVEMRFNKQLDSFLFHDSPLPFFDHNLQGPSPVHAGVHAFSE